MSISIKCPNCAAGLVFDADTQLMTCKFCGTTINAQDIAVEQDAGLKQETKAAWESNAVSYVCSNCAATVVTDQNTSATFCAFCGSPTIIPERLIQGYRPSYIIPFKYGREEAIQAFYKWCRKGLMTPKDFTSEKNMEKITGMYLPFWLFDVDTDMNFAGTGISISSSSSSSSTTTTTKYYDTVRQRKVSWDRIPFDGATHVDDKLMEIIEPYSYNDMIPFDMKYLSGFYAEKFNQDAKELLPRLTERIEQYKRNVYRDAFKQYANVVDVKDTSVIHEPRPSYALMPVWMLNYTYRGKKYTFAMNGQTGKIAGDPPLSKEKLAIAAISAATIGGLVFSLFGGLLS